jgi:hypothetical protein
LPSQVLQRARPIVERLPLHVRGRDIAHGLRPTARRCGRRSAGG